MTQNQQTSAPLRIGIKYCGGCNPHYDRVALVSALEKELSSKAVLVHWEERDLDLIIAVQGCPTACADLDMFEASKVLLITDAAELTPLVDKILRRCHPL